MCWFRCTQSPISLLVFLKSIWGKETYIRSVHQECMRKPTVFAPAVWITSLVSVGSYIMRQLNGWHISFLFLLPIFFLYYLTFPTSSFPLSLPLHNCHYIIEQIWHTYPRMGWHGLHIAFIWLFLGWFLRWEQDNENHTVTEHKICHHFGCSLAAHSIS